MDDLWTAWAAHYRQLGIHPRRICKDGILCTKEYERTSCRILFVLREANDFEGGDLRELFKDGPKFALSHMVARWAAGFLRNFPSYELINTTETMYGALRQVALINLKKTSGKAQSDLSVINAYAHQDRELLLRQMEDIRPKWIVACGTLDPLVWLLGLRLNADQPAMEPIPENSHKAWVVPFRHPTRASGRKTYEDLAKQVRHLL